MSFNPTGSPLTAGQRPMPFPQPLPSPMLPGMQAPGFPPQTSPFNSPFPAPPNFNPAALGQMPQDILQLNASQAGPQMPGAPAGQPMMDPSALGQQPSLADTSSPSGGISALTVAGGVGVGILALLGARYANRGDIGWNVFKIMKSDLKNMADEAKNSIAEGAKKIHSEGHKALTDLHGTPEADAIKKHKEALQPHIDGLKQFKSFKLTDEQKTAKENLLKAINTPIEEAEKKAADKQALDADFATKHKKQLDEAFTAFKAKFSEHINFEGAVTNSFANLSAAAKTAFNEMHTKAAAVADHITGKASSDEIKKAQEAAVKAYEDGKEHIASLDDKSKKALEELITPLKAETLDHSAHSKAHEAFEKQFAPLLHEKAVADIKIQQDKITRLEAKLKDQGKLSKPEKLTDAKAALAAAQQRETKFKTLQEAK